MAQVFISFRNQDEPYAAALLYTLLAREIGRESVFRSSDSLFPGSRWAEEIWNQHRDCKVLLAVIGPGWLTIADDDGRPRLFRDDDWVRAEIAAALAESKVVIPVMVGGAARLGADTRLPADMAELAELQAFEFRHRRAEASSSELARLLITYGVTPGRDRDPLPEREPADCPVWNVPRLSPFSVTRHGALDALRRAVAESGGTGPIVVHGQIGSGKTDLVTTYARRFASDYSAAWWIPADQPDLIPAHFAALAQAMRFNAGPEVRAALPVLSARLSEIGRWLLIFDGVSEPAVVAPFLTALSGGDILLTSRDADWGVLAAASVEVGPFQRTESVGLLRNLISDAGDDLDRLAGALDDIPLALAQAGVFLAGAPMTPAKYAELLRSRGRELLARGETMMYPGSLAAAWSLGVERLTATRPAAVELLRLVSVFAAAPIEFDLLGQAADGAGMGLELEQAARSLGDPILRSDLARTLTNSGLVEVYGAGVLPHGLLQSFIRQGLEEGHAAGLREAARGALARRLRDDPRGPHAESRYAPLLPHVVALEMEASDDPACRRCLLDVVQYLTVRADAGTACTLAERALRRWRSELAPDDPILLDAAAHLAQAHYWLGDYAQAAALDEEVLVRRQADGDPGALGAAHNLGIDRWAAGIDRQDARQLMADVASERRRELGPAHPDTLRSAHNQALAVRGDGEYSEALGLDREVHRGLVAALGADHPDTLRSAYAVALDLLALGEYETALTLAEDTRRRQHQVLGADHPDTLRSAYGVAVGLRATGDLPDARALARDTYERRVKILGAEDVDTVRAEYLLGELLIQTGEQEAGDRLRDHAGALFLRMPARRGVATPRGTARGAVG